MYPYTLCIFISTDLQCAGKSFYVNRNQNFWWRKKCYWYSFRIHFFYYFCQNSCSPSCQYCCRPYRRHNSRHNYHKFCKTKKQRKKQKNKAAANFGFKQILKQFKYSLIIGKFRKYGCEDKRFSKYRIYLKILFFFIVPDSECIRKILYV